jgi:hypothetical protein
MIGGTIFAMVGCKLKGLHVANQNVNIKDVITNNVKIA